jgi:Tol biopolymer transport system component
MKIRFIRFAFIIPVIMSLLDVSLHAQSIIPVLFENESQVGNPEKPGSFEYKSAGQKYILKGSGENIWFDNDQFYFLWKKVKGDFFIQSRILFIGEGNHEHRKIGLMMRKSVSAGSPHFSGTVHGDGLTSLQYRLEEKGETMEVKAEITMPEVIRLERKGDQVEFSFAAKGEEFKKVSFEEEKPGEEYLVGLFICSHDENYYEEAVFDNVRLTIPAPADLVPYQEYLGSRIEVLDMGSGTRKILHTSPLSLQAPNWTKDGKNLIYNSEGRLYNLSIATRSITEINTGFAIRNNNDHVLSFDGNMMGISHHSEEDDGKSMIYILPAEGGVPEKITQKGPSYFHGWSPDGKFLTYTGGRDGNYDIYKIHIEDKDEIRLTDTEALDDGSEYSPDGEYIYFNSARTGTMQIWRMKPDGTEQEQLTFDAYNDWFPHISPDGKNMVFISYMPEIKADDHPFYKYVYIRKMSTAGGKPEVIARFYGGQGTINVHSWSPDGKKIAFVTNSGAL